MDRKSAKKRAAELVAQMTLEKRASQLRYDAPAIKHLQSNLAVPNYGLCAFQRLSLEKEENQKIALAIPEKAFTIIDDEGKRYRDSTQFKLYIGFHQPDERSVELTGSRPIEIVLNM